MIQKEKLSQFYFSQYKDCAKALKKKNNEGKKTYMERLDRLLAELKRSKEGKVSQAHLEEYADASTQRGQCMLKTICEKFGFDSLGYQSLDGLLEAIGLDRDKVCTYCWNGKE